MYSTKPLTPPSKAKSSSLPMRWSTNLMRTPLLRKDNSRRRLARMSLSTSSAISAPSGSTTAGKSAPTSSIGICRFSNWGLVLTHVRSQFATYLPWRGQITGPLAAGVLHTGRNKNRAELNESRNEYEFSKAKTFINASASLCTIYSS